MKTVVRVRVEASVHPTESAAKVRTAILKVFPDALVSEETNSLVAETMSMETFQQLVRNQRIRDAAREVLIRGRRGNVTKFRLSKQAAFVGRVNFAERPPLGDLSVTVEDDDLDALIDRVAESTLGRRLKKPDRIEGM